MRVSILIPIPKGSRVDTRNSDNYRAVALSSILGKILDNIIISVQGESLSTSDLQFGYKPNLSTMMCSTLVVETIHYFTSMCSPVFVLFVDASKAFDRLCHIELFKILCEREMCPVYRRLLFNLYDDQRIRVRWDNCLSNMFEMRNGVRQGAVLSPNLFTLYIDGLLQLLKQSGVGCHVGNTYAGAFGYADDIVLLAPSLDSLHFMIGICETYARHYSILFNPRKSKLLCYNVKNVDFQLQLCGQPVAYVSNETYLGNYIGNDILDRGITQSMCSYSYKTNHVIANFSMLDSFLLCKLHSTFCMSLYGSELWNLNSRYIESIHVTWRKSMRKLFKLPYRAHNYIVCGITEPISIKLHRRQAKFIYSMINSRNNTVRDMTTFLLTRETSTLAENYRFIMYTYSIPVFLWQKSLSGVLKLCTSKQLNSLSELNVISTVKELINIRDQLVDSPLSPIEAGMLINELCVS